MRRRWLWALFAGLVIGGAVGFAWGRGAFVSPRTAAGGPARGHFLDQFDVVATAAKVGPGRWTPVPAQPEMRAGEPSADALDVYGLRGKWSADEVVVVSRRLVARAELPAADRGKFFRAFTDAVADEIRAAGAVTRGGGHGDAPAGEKGPAGAWVYWSYQHYQVATTERAGGLSGVVQAWLAGDGPAATLIVSIAEARYEAK